MNEALPAGQEKVTVLWNGGWDDYIIDTDTLREMTPDEVARFTTDNARYFPDIPGGWLKVWFITKYQTLRNSCVKIIQHLGGGD